MPEQGRLRRFAVYLRPFTGSVVVLFGTILLAILINLPTPWCEKLIIDEAIGKGRGELLLPLVAFIAGLFVVHRLLLYFRGYLSVRVKLKVLTAVRMDMYAHLQRMSLSFFSKNPSGSLLSRLTNDVGYVQNLLNDELFEVISSAVKVLVVVGLLFAISTRLTLFCMCVMPVIAVVFLLFKKRVYQRNLELQETQARLSGQVQQNFAGMKLIQAEVMEDRARDDTLAASRELEQVGIRREMVGVTGNLLTTVLSYVPVLCILWGVGGQMVIEKQLSLGELLAYTQYLLGLVTPVTRFFQFNMNLQAGYAALDRIHEVMDTKPDILDAPGARELDEPIHSVELQGVSLLFPGDGGASVTALDDVSLKIGRGEKVALVGPSGAGKTSVLHLLLRFYDPTEGQVLINGRPATDFTLRSLRRGMAYLCQEVFLFSTSVRQNLVLGREVPETRLREALQLSAADSFVEELEQGLDAPVLEQGSNLSGGQRQRLALARALTRDAGLLLLDEATAALDPRTEQQVLQRLHKYLEGRTALLVAHRYSLLEMVDRVLVFANGRLVEQGTLQELQDQGGVLSALMGSLRSPLKG